MKKAQIKTGIIGCGNIGEQLILFLRRHPGFKVCTLTDVDSKKAKAVQKGFRGTQPEIVSIDEALIKNQLIIESAGRNAVIEILNSKNLELKKKKILCLSSGGLIHSLNKMADLRRTEFMIPSGAIAGLDAIKAVAGEIEMLQLVTTKPAKSLFSARYVLSNAISLNNLKRPKTIFEGRLNEAIKGFPENINVAASLYWASRFKKIKIKIIADPSAQFNTHEITCIGKFGTICTKTENRPSKNPKTSQLAILSAISMLSSLAENFHVGN